MFVIREKPRVDSPQHIGHCEDDSHGHKELLLRGKVAFILVQSPYQDDDHCGQADRQRRVE